MAFYNQKDDDELQGQQQPASTGPQGAALGGGSGPGGGAPQTAAGAPAAPGKPDNPGNFVGIQTYLNANKKQAGKLGDQTAAVINNSAQQARTGLNNLNNNFNQQAVGVQNDQNALGKVGQAESLNDQEKNTVKNQYNAQYTGPQDLTSLNNDYSNVQSQINKAFQNQQAAGTEQGRVGLIQQVNSKPRTAGQDTFDNALLSSGGGRQKVAQAAAANTDVNNDLLNNANIAAQQRATDAKNLTDQTRQATQTAVGGAGDALNNQITQEQAQKVQQQEALKTQIGAALKSGKINAEQAQSLALDPNMRTFGLDLSKYADNLNVSDIDLTKADVASDQEMARRNALADISGQAAPDWGQKEGRFGLNLGYDLNDAIANQKQNFLTAADKNIYNDYIYNNKDGGSGKTHTAGDDIRAMNNQFGFGSGGNTLGHVSATNQVVQPGLDQFINSLSQGSGYDEGKAALAQGMTQYYNDINKSLFGNNSPETANMITGGIYKDVIPGINAGVQGGYTPTANGSGIGALQYNANQLGENGQGEFSDLIKKYIAQANQKLV
jgi:hypothetical protein